MHFLCPKRNSLPYKKDPDLLMKISCVNTNNNEPEITGIISVQKLIRPCVTYYARRIPNFLLNSHVFLVFRYHILFLFLGLADQQI